MQFSTKILKFLPITTIAAACALGAFEVSAQTLLLRYNFDESATGTEEAIDSGTTPAAPGTLQGGALRTADTPGSASTGALDTSAASTYVDGGDAEKLNGLSSLTLTAWVKLVGNPAHGNRVMAKQFNSGNFDGFSFAFNNPTAGTIAANNFRLNLALGGTGGFSFKMSGNDLSADNEWTFVAVTYDGAGNVIFYSGKENAVVTQLGETTKLTGVDDPGTLVGHTLPFRVAASSAGTASAPVLIDDARVYSGVLDATALEAVRLANLQSTPTAVTITDTSRSGNTVTFSFATQTGKTHTVQYKNALEDASWSLLTTVTGDGETEVVTDNAATPATRFYRVVTE